ncbi:hypothetical protein AMTR_s00009p00264410 [Amborella trichopoda]|uniref:Uncharacterized protein n=1 Tax=Amborella trichopoda TaxID=13333 RepID=W1NJ08_AMBTC|nr:hypothetical protein AMTR_s00009p00264410 [Amborella trichopoda]
MYVGGRPGHAPRQGRWGGCTLRRMYRGEGEGEGEGEGLGPGQMHQSKRLVHPNQGGRPEQMHLGGCSADAPGRMPWANAPWADAPGRMYLGGSPGHRPRYRGRPGPGQMHQRGHLVHPHQGGRPGRMHLGGCSANAPGRMHIGRMHLGMRLGLMHLSAQGGRTPGGCTRAPRANVLERRTYPRERGGCTDPR